MDFEHMHLDTDADRAHWAAEMGVDLATLAEAVRAVGDEVDKVRAWLASPSRYAREKAAPAG